MQPFNRLNMASLAALTSRSMVACQPYRIGPATTPVEPGRDAFSVSSPTVAEAEDAWWRSFGDAKLDAMVRSALDGNLNVRQAVARLDQAGALTRRVGTVRYPQVSIDASAGRVWRDDDPEERLSQIGGALSWEIDVFNRLGAATIAQKQTQMARFEDVRTVRLSLSAAVADAYFDAVEQRHQLMLLNQQIALDRDLLELTELRFEAGLTASVDVLQQSSQLAETESLVPPVRAALRVAENRLDVLIGQAPDAHDRISDDDRFVDVGDLPFLGVPSDLLLNRPDLRAQRYQLVAADARIAQAMAERLPRIVLDGSLAYEDVPGFSGLAAALLGSLVQPLLDWGARQAEVERNQALYRERLAAFAQAYLDAIEDVENALYQERQQREFLDRLDRRRRLLARTVEETRDRYTNGLTDFLPVLDALKELQRLERIIIRQQRDLLGFRIQLHRALGGAVEVS